MADISSSPRPSPPKARKQLVWVAPVHADHPESPESKLFNAIIALQEAKDIIVEQQALVKQHREFSQLACKDNAALQDELAKARRELADLKYDYGLLSNLNEGHREMISNMVPKQQQSDRDNHSLREVIGGLSKRYAAEKCRVIDLEHELAESKGIQSAIAREANQDIDDLHVIVDFHKKRARDANVALDKAKKTARMSTGN